jgi:hypothetical protein
MSSPESERHNFLSAASHLQSVIRIHRRSSRVYKACKAQIHLALPSNCRRAGMKMTDYTEQNRTYQRTLAPHVSHGDSDNTTQMYDAACNNQRDLRTPFQPMQTVIRTSHTTHNHHFFNACYLWQPAIFTSHKPRSSQVFNNN